MTYLELMSVTYVIIVIIAMLLFMSVELLTDKIDIIMGVIMVMESSLIIRQGLVITAI